MTRLVLALALLTAAAPAWAQSPISAPQWTTLGSLWLYGETMLRSSDALEKAQEICAHYVTTICTTMPPSVCDYEPAWRDACFAIDKRVRAEQSTTAPEKQRQKEAQDQRDLEFVRSLARQSLPDEPAGRP